MNATTPPQWAYVPAAPAREDHSPWAAPSPQEIEAALERMSVRINAATAHRNSLNRAAQGVRTISIALGLLLNRRVADVGRTAATHLAGAAIEAMREEVDAVLAADGVISVAIQRARLRRAVWRGRHAFLLLAP
jgi:hypothetical protein